MSLLRYFAYGSNMHPARLRERIPSCKFIDVVKLNGWALKFHKRSKDGSGKCNIISTNNRADHVYGVLYELPKEEKADLDKIEAVGFGYHNKTIEIQSYSEVFTYQADSDYIDESLKPYTWYKEYLVQGAQLHGIPNDYIEFLASIEAIQDPDASREERNLISFE